MSRQTQASLSRGIRHLRTAGPPSGPAPVGVVTVHGGDQGGASARGDVEPPWGGEGPFGGIWEGGLR